VWKKAVVAYFKYYTGIFLERVGKLQKISVRTVGITWSVHRYKGKDIIKTDFEEAGCKHLERNEMADDRIQWGAF
jgi:hypothetical protein